MKVEHDPQLQATPNRTPAKRRNLSCVVVPTRLPDEHARRREKLCKVLAELKIDLISVTDSISHQLLRVLAQRLDAFALDDDVVGHTPLIEHRIETGNSLPFRQSARPSSLAHCYALALSPRRTQENAPTPHGQKGWNRQNVGGLQATQSDDNQRCQSPTANR